MHAYTFNRQEGRNEGGGGGGGMASKADGTKGTIVYIYIYIYIAFGALTVKAHSGQKCTVTGKNCRHSVRLN